MIDNAKEYWAEVNNLPPGSPSIDLEVEKYIRGGRPKCPNGGQYTFRKIGEHARCSFTGHSIE